MVSTYCTCSSYVVVCFCKMTPAVRTVGPLRAAADAIFGPDNDVRYRLYAIQSSNVLAADGAAQYIEAWSRQRARCGPGYDFVSYVYSCECAV